MTTKAAKAKSPIVEPAAKAPKKKLAASKPSSNPFVSDHANHLDRGPKYGSSGSRRGK